MTLGVAIFASVVLILLVYNKPFRKASAWVAGVLAGLALVGALGWYLYGKYQEHVEAKQAAAHDKLVTACVLRLTGIDTNKKPPPDTLPAKFFDVVEVCVQNPDAVDRWEKYEVKPQFDPNKPYSAVVEIHGGETLKIAQPKPSNTSTGLHVISSVPTIYIGQGQEFRFVCGNFGEQGYEPSFKRGEVSCPWVDYKEAQKP
jgi:hypothetical protein